MTRDLWRDICRDMKQRVARRNVVHCSTAIGETADGKIKRAGFTYRLSPVERALKELPQKGMFRRRARQFAKLAAAQSSSGGVARPADRLDEGGEVS